MYCSHSTCILQPKTTAALNNEKYTIHPPLLSAHGCIKQNRQMDFISIKKKHRLSNTKLTMGPLCIFFKPHKLLRGTANLPGHLCKSHRSVRKFLTEELCTGSQLWKLSIIYCSSSQRDPSQLELGFSLLNLPRKEKLSTALHSVLMDFFSYSSKEQRSKKQRPPKYFCKFTEITPRCTVYLNTHS